MQCRQSTKGPLEETGRGGGCKVEVRKERRGRTSAVGTGTKEKAQTAEMPGENRLGWRLPCSILTVSVIDHKAWKPLCKETWEMQFLG